MQKIPFYTTKDRLLQPQRPPFKAHKTSLFYANSILVIRNNTIRTKQTTHQCTETGCFRIFHCKGFRKRPVTL